MKRYLIILLATISLTASAQSWEMFYKIKTRTEPFRVAIARDKVVYCIADSALYSLDTTAKATDSLASIIRWGKYTIVGGGSGGTGDSYWTEAASNLANIDTTTGFYVNSTSGVKNVNLSMYPASSWWRLEQTNRTTGVQSVAQGSAGVVSLQANAGGSLDVIQVNGGGYLYGRSGSNGLNLGSSMYRWGLLNSDSVNTKTIYANGRDYSNAVYGQSRLAYGVKGHSDLVVGVWGQSTSGSGVVGVSYLGGTAGQFIGHRQAKGLYVTSDSNYCAIFAHGNVGIGKTDPSTALDVIGTITATGGTSTNWNTAYAWGNHADAGYLANPMTLTGDMVYNNLLDDGVQRLPIGSEGQVLKSITTNPGGTPITTPTWSNPDWTTSGSNIYRSGGFVGVNTTKPLSRFHTVGAVRSDTALTPVVLGGSDVSSSLTLQSTSGYGSSDYIAFKTGSGSERVRILSDGKVGIGTTNTGGYDVKLVGTFWTTSSILCDGGISSVLSQTINANAKRVIGNINTGTSSAIAIYTKNIEAITIDPSQRVGIGTTAPAAKVDIAGNMKLGGTDTTGVGSTANVGAIHYYSGHFYGLIPGSPPQWKQLDN